MSALPFSLAANVEDAWIDTRMSVERQRTMLIDRSRLLGTCLREIRLVGKYLEVPEIPRARIKELFDILLRRMSKLSKEIDLKISSVESDLKYIKMAAVPATPRKPGVTVDTMHMEAIRLRSRSQVAHFNALLGANSHMRQKALGRVPDVYDVADIAGGDDCEHLYADAAGVNVR